MIEFQELSVPMCNLRMYMQSSCLIFCLAYEREREKVCVSERFLQSGTIVYAFFLSFFFTSFAEPTSKAHMLPLMNDVLSNRNP